MIDINVGNAQEKVFRDLLLRAHDLKTRVQLCDLSGNHKKDLSPMFLDGQVTVDATAEVTRALDISFIDPLGKIDIEPDSPSKSSIFIADLMKVWVVMRDPTTDKVYQVPVFTGPIDAVTRTDMFLDVKCVGKERLALDNVWSGKVFKKGQKKTDVIRWILVNMVGETALDIPDRAAKLSRDLKVSHDDVPWKVASQLAGSMNLLLLYDGRGIARLRARSSKPSLILTEKWVSDYPQVAFDLTEGVYNAVRVIGGKPKKAKTKITWTEVASKTDSLSPWRLGRNGVPRFITYLVEDDSIRTLAEAKSLAKDLLDSGLKSGVSFTVDGIMDPRLEEYDVVRAAVGDVSVQSSIKSFTIPLTAGDDGSYGYVRRINPKGGARIIKRHRNKHRRHRHHAHAAASTVNADGKKSA